jgi:hypothetical protein
MGKFVATLTGETDGHAVTREFTELNAAINWLQGEGLVDFDDQVARGEVVLDRNVIWTKSHLQTKEQAARGAKADLRLLGIDVDLYFKRRS